MTEICPPRDPQKRQFSDYHLYHEVLPPLDLSVAQAGFYQRMFKPRLYFGGDSDQNHLIPRRLTS